MIADDEIIVDCFAGGGGASEAIFQATGRHPDIAINHDPEAVAMHAINHPQTRHFCQNIYRVEPREVCGRRKVGLAWFSPDCTDHSKAKGGKPVKTGRRDLAWVVIAWAKTVRPRLIFLENVEEWEEWGPCIQDTDGNWFRDPERKGNTFKRWCREMRRLGYELEYDFLVAADYGAPTTRRRLFLVARCDGAPIVWPKPTHSRNGEDGLIPWLSAGEHVIDWSLDCPSIFLTKEEGRAVGVKRPLVENTMARIAAGIHRYVLHPDAQPFIVPITHSGAPRTYPAVEPVRTITTAQRGEFALINPFVTRFNKGVVGREMKSPPPTVTANSFVKRPGGAPPMGVVAPYFIPRYGERPGQEPRARSATRPYPTIVPTSNEAQIVAPRFDKVASFLAQHNLGMIGHHALEPVSTITEKGPHQAVVSAGLLNLKGEERRLRSVGMPANTLTSGEGQLAAVQAFLIKYHRDGGQWQSAHDPAHTIPTRDNLGIVQLFNDIYQLADIGMRMLIARELYRAQGFRDSYIIDPVVNGVILSKTAQIRMCGNSVSPPPAAALIRANVVELPRRRKPIPMTPIEERIAA